MSRYIRFAVNLIPGPLQAPDGSHPFIDIDDFARSARLAERARVDTVFFADSQGLAPRGQGYAYLDPLVVLPALARETEHVGLVATVSTTYSTPYALARSILSLDHLSHGRAGWNVVTTMDPAVARNFGSQEAPPRAERYRRAQEFTEVVDKLWASWPDDVTEAWDLDRLRHSPIDHRGEFFSVAGPLQLPRSRQGRPVIFQAGGSDQGIDTAARFADAVFSVGVDEQASRDYRQRLNKEARGVRGDSASVLVLPGIFFSVGSTTDEVHRLLHDAEQALESTDTLRRSLARFGLDPETADLDGPLPPEIAVTAGTRSIGFAQGGVDLARRQPDLTLRRFLVLGGGGHRRVFGTPESIADELTGWVDRDAADGFTVFAESLPQFAEHIVPVLRDRGVHRREYTGTTLRDNFRQHTG
ncbi:FMN-dependent oxidoreductase (nitrilotriacetate monooxygenase family) [Nocardia transvalensis]|uniref:FMN-dependent oxidoreductase (Nitrilotriacetate monooxygenase family) n=1 Tax=Nocardia transvalensis TaxID=37333 RepID=A0A7W9UK26_9NOCA|nr:NtaA/DmoA family FMN-dependent monooxygenase [Nocardia transvalensis]MBB5916098.1 FMN-dependent oxidoreductase (nitrilotriacetate monooxygenase family) [Nocardia transvalensis]